jgi:esterase/lipase superfamily enzyme
LPNIQDHGQLQAIRSMHIILGSVQNDVCLDDNFKLAHILGSKGISHTLEVWDDFKHDWPWWRRMVQKYFGPMRPYGF